MKENTEKKVIAFTSQVVSQYGIRAVRMDDIAQSMNVSKRTIYQTYATKDQLISACLECYLGRMRNLFPILEYNHPEVLDCLWEISKAYMENLYKAKRVFWSDVAQQLKYEYIYHSYNGIWSDQLAQTIVVCQREKYVLADLDVPMFVNTFTTLLYNGRVTGCSPAMLHNSAHFMLRGILTEEGMKQWDKVFCASNNRET